MPAAYQKIAGLAKVIGTNTTGGPLGYDLDVFFYDDTCTILMASQGVGTDETAYMPSGTTWMLVHNYQGDPNTSAYVELSPN